MNSRSNMLTGEIRIPASMSMSVFSGVSVIILCCIILFLIYGKFTKKAHLSGIVMPSSGLVKITPRYTGYVTRLTVREGEYVTAGTPLYHISGEYYNGKGIGTLEALRLSLQSQYTMLISQQSQEQNDNNQQQNAIRQRITDLKPQLSSAAQRLKLAEQQAALSESVMNRYKKLVSSHYVSDAEYQQKQIDASAAKGNVENQRQLQLQLHTSLAAAEDDLAHLRALGESRKTELDRQLQVIRHQQLELAGQANVTLTAPVSGVVAAILVRAGQSVQPQEPMMTLVPDGAQPRIELYATSRNAGFIQQGQKVSLRFAAFPYQKFGVRYGTVRELSRVTLTPADMAAVSPVTWKENEGHYRVIVEPEHPFIRAYGKNEPLRPGMTLEGDVSLDTRYLWEWLTEPLWSLRGIL